MSKLKYLDGLFDGLKPTPHLTVSEWAEKYRYLSPESSYLGGQLYSCAITPYAKPIMDALSIYSTYNEVIFCKASQTGGTEIGNNWIGYIIHIAPAPTLMLMPTDGTVERNSKIRIDPMIAHCKELKTRVSEKKSRDGENTINQKKFPLGVLYMGGANSPAVLKSIPCCNVMLDEVDEYPSDLGGQGSADELARVRTRAFPNRKIYYVSTPTVEGESLIMRKFLETDQNYWEVPCPFCGAYQKLIFEQLKYEDGKPNTVKYECIHCNALIDEDYKDSIVSKGKFTPSKKENISSKKIGFHINSLYAPTAFFSWSEIIEMHINSEKDPNKRKVFVNTILGETFSETSETVKFEDIYNKRESYSINSIHNDVCFLTMGADIQKDRIEYEIVGWCKNKESYSIDYRVLLGSPNLPDVWNELEKIINDVWIREDGSEMPIKLTAIDSGGHHTSEVYDFCRKFPFNKVIPIKGSSNYQAPAVAAPRTIDYNMKGKKIGKTKVWIIGVSYLKHELFSWLGIYKVDEIDKPMYCHFPEYDSNYFKGLTSEVYIPSKKLWKKTFERNEPLDCRVYARAASIVVGLDRLKPEQIEALSGSIKRERRVITDEPRSEVPRRERRKITDSIW